MTALPNQGKYLMTAAVILFALIMVFSSAANSTMSSASNASKPSDQIASTSAPAIAPSSTVAMNRLAPAHPAPTPSSAPAESFPSPASYAASPYADSPIHSLLPAPAVPYQNLAPWAQKILGVHDAATSHLEGLTSYPNYGIVSDPHQVTGQISPFYTEQPAPMGIADLGLNATGAYAYNASHFLGQVYFSAPPNATSPDSERFINPGGTHENDAGSVYEFGIQLNTVIANVSLPGGIYSGWWAQNVVDMNDTSLQFVSELWNFSSYGAGLSPGSTLEPGGCAGPLNSSQIVAIWGIWNCFGPTVHISPADYPLTIQFYNNATVNATNNHDQVVFGYNIFGAHGFRATGVAGNPVFTGIANPSSPIGNQVNGYETTPDLAYYDSELTFAGQIGGDNAVFTSLNGTLSLQYSNQDTGGWKNVPSAFDYGTDTGETSSGIAGSWLKPGVEQIVAGPSVLHGLWNTSVPVTNQYASVPKGDIQFKGTINPNYGFIFLTAGTQDPNSLNSSQVPVSSSGTFDTYLPILNGTQYSVQAFAPGFDEFNGTPFSTSQSSYAIVMTKNSAVMNAPIYIDGNAQAASVAKNLTASSTAPWVFSNLSLDLNNSFGHINDYDYPNFVYFQAQELSSTIRVNNTVEGGAQTLITDNSYASPTYTGLVNYTSELNLFLDHAPIVSNETLDSEYIHGSNIFLWKDTDALMWNDTSVGNIFGIFTGDSVHTLIENYLVADYGTGITDVGAKGTTIDNMAYYDYYLSDYEYYDDYFYGLKTTSTTDTTVDGFYCDGTGSYCIFNEGVLEAVSGVYTYYNLPGGNGTVIAGLVEPTYTWGIYDQDTIDMKVVNTTIYDGAYFGMECDLCMGTDVDWWNMSLGDSYGMFLDYSNWTNVTHVTTADVYEFVVGGEYDDKFAVDDIATNDSFAGVYLEYVGNASVDDSTNWFTYDSYWDTQEVYGVYGEYDNYLTIDNQKNYFQNDSEYDLYGTYLDYTGNVTADHVIGNITSDSIDDQPETFYAEYGWFYDLSDFSGVGNWTSDNWVYDIYLYYIWGATITSASVWYGTSVDADDSYNIDVSGASATWDAEAVWFEYTTGTISGTSATQYSDGALLWDSSSDLVTGTTATVSSLAVLLYDSDEDTVLATTASWSIGVDIRYSSQDMVNGVTATNTTFSGFENGVEWWGVPLSAVLTYDTDRVDVANVSATNYGAGIYDEYSENLLVDQLTASHDWFGMLLNGTSYGTFANEALSSNWEGIQINDDAYSNFVTTSSFTENTAYGVDIESGTYNVIYNNDFVGNNGASSTYSPLHIQAWSTTTNYFNSSAQIGNYWADWHSFNSAGHLNPYYISDGVWDYYPLGVGQGSTAVYFWESGLPSGTTWSVTLGHTTVTSTSNWILASAAPGANTFTIGAVPGYTSTPTTGTVTGGVTLTANESVSFVKIPPAPTYYTVNIDENGLAPGTSWTASFNGVPMTGSNGSLAYSVLAGTYQYQIAPVAGYNVSSASGTVSVNGNYTLWVTFTSTSVPPPPTYSVTIMESGLPANAAWNATFDGTTISSSTGSVAWSSVLAGTYDFQISPVAGYSVSPSSGSVTISGNYVITVTFTPVVYAVTIEEAGLAAGQTWTATLNGASQSTGGTSVTFYLANGTYTYAATTSASGYTVSCPSSSVTVKGNAVSAGCTFTPPAAPPAPATVSPNTAEDYLAIALAVALVGIVLAFLAILMRPKGNRPSGSGNSGNPPPPPGEDASSSHA